MSPDALPYTVLLLLVELAAGALAFVTVFDARNMVTRGYVQMAGIIALPSLLLAAWLYSSIEQVTEVDGYLLRPAAFDVFRVTLTVSIALTLVYFVGALGGWRGLTLASGAAAAVAGVVTLGALATVIEAPTWSWIGLFGSMVTGALVVGGTLMAMSWGHWYLTNSGLPKEPMEQMSLGVLGALVAQTIFIVLAVAIPARAAPFSNSAFAGSLGENPAFWLRVGVGLLFPGALAWLAWKAASMRGMMSATGLLYIATGAVLTGEALGRALLFATGAAV